MGLACIYRIVRNVFLFWLMIEIIATIAIYIYGYHVIDSASNTFFYDILTNLTGATIIRAEDESNPAIIDILVSASSGQKPPPPAGGAKPPPWPPPSANGSEHHLHHHYHHGIGGAGGGRHPPPPHLILDQMTDVIYEQDINALKYYAKAWLVAVLGQGLFYLSIGMIGVVTENRWVTLVYATICLIGDLINIIQLQETVPIIVSFYVNIAHTLLAFWFFLLLKKRPIIENQPLSDQPQSEDTE